MSIEKCLLCNHVRLTSKLYSGYDFVIATGSDIVSTSNIRGYGYDCYIYGFLSHHKSSQKRGNGQRSLSQALTIQNYYLNVTGSFRLRKA